MQTNAQTRPISALHKKFTGFSKIPIDSTAIKATMFHSIEE